MKSMNEVKGSTGTKFIRMRMKQVKKIPASQEGLFKEETTKALGKKAFIHYSGGNF